MVFRCTKGVASTKKIAKQYAAQALLAILHERTVSKYYEVADLYSNLAKGQTMVSESSATGAARSSLAVKKQKRVVRLVL